MKQIQHTHGDTLKASLLLSMQRSEAIRRAENKKIDYTI